MNELMDFYWDWGVFISGILVFLFGIFMGAILANEKHKKALCKEIEKTLIPVSASSENSRP